MWLKCPYTFLAPLYVCMWVEIQDTIPTAFFLLSWEREGGKLIKKSGREETERNRQKKGGRDRGGVKIEQDETVERRG